jgi:hypothetical protein
MALNPEILTAIAREVARSPVDGANMTEHVATLSALLDGIEKLRALPLKDCEPRLVFQPIED